MNRLLAGLFWALLYLVLVLSPLVLMLLPPRPEPRPFTRELAAVLGFVALVQIGLQFVLVARFQRVTEPYGIDMILQYHRQIGFASLAVVVGHAALAAAAQPALLPLLLAPWRAGSALGYGLAATLAFLLLIGLSVWRRRVRLSYELWRGSHAAQGATLLGLAMLHVRDAGVYTNSTFKWGLWLGFAGAMLAVYGYLRLLKPALQARAPYRVTDVRVERGRSWTLALEPQGHAGLRFLPGQFVWLKLGASPFNRQEHPFSFSSSAEHPERLEFGIKALGDFTATIGDTSVGTPAYLDGPHGSMSIDRYPAAGYVFIAGGVGVTPIVSMLRTMADRDDRRPCLLIYADDSWERMPFREQIAELEQRMELDVVHVLEEPHEGWDGEIGRIDAAMLERCLPRERIRRDHFVCGPNPMIDAIEDMLLARGVPASAIHSERFTLV
jgi:predicted ferric reductase